MDTIMDTTTALSAEAVVDELAALGRRNAALLAAEEAGRPGTGKDLDRLYDLRHALEVVLASKEPTSAAVALAMIAVGYECFTRIRDSICPDEAAIKARGLALIEAGTRYLERALPPADAVIVGAVRGVYA
jgi:hypothetical protein